MGLVGERAGRGDIELMEGTDREEFLKGSRRRKGKAKSGQAQQLNTLAQDVSLGWSGALPEDDAHAKERPVEQAGGESAAGGAKGGVGGSGPAAEDSEAGMSPRQRDHDAAGVGRLRQ